MKRHYIYSFVCILMFSLLFSCDDFLNENPKDKIPEEDAYKSLTDLYYNAVASLYNNIGGYSDSQGLQGTGRGIYDLNTFTTDEAIMPTRGGDWYDGGFWQGLFLHRWGVDNDAIQATWEYLYKVIGLCNQSLERIDTYQETHHDMELNESNLFCWKVTLTLMFNSMSRVFKGVMPTAISVPLLRMEPIFAKRVL